MQYYTAQITEILVLLNFLEDAMSTFFRDINSNFIQCSQKWTAFLRWLGVFNILGFVWEFGGEGFGGWEIWGKMEKSVTFFEKSIFLENDKLMFLINIFLILRIL